MINFPINRDSVTFFKEYVSGGVDELADALVRASDVQGLTTLLELGEVRPDSSDTLMCAVFMEQLQGTEVQSLRDACAERCGLTQRQEVEALIKHASAPLQGKLFPSLLGLLNHFGPRGEMLQVSREMMSHGIHLDLVGPALASARYQVQHCPGQIPQTHDGKDAIGVALDAQGQAGKQDDQRVLEQILDVCKAAGLDPRASASRHWWQIINDQRSRSDVDFEFCNRDVYALLKLIARNELSKDLIIELWTHHSWLVDHDDNLLAGATLPRMLCHLESRRGHGVDVLKVLETCAHHGLLDVECGRYEIRPLLLVAVYGSSTMLQKMCDLGVSLDGINALVDDAREVADFVHRDNTEQNIALLQALAADLAIDDSSEHSKGIKPL